MFTRLPIFQKILYINCNRFKQTTKTRDPDPKAIQQINFTGNLNRAEVGTMFFIIEESKETAFDFSKRAIKVL